MSEMVERVKAAQDAERRNWMMSSYSGNRPSNVFWVGEGNMETDTPKANQIIDNALALTAGA